MDTYVVKRLEQAKLLTDPFKLKLLERFGGKPVTTKQVADGMGEKAPRLYRHVDALVDEGLLELVEERPKRGTIERYYRTVAGRFEVDPNLFSTSSGVADDALDMLRSIFRDTESDLVRIFDRLKDGEPDPEDLPLVMRLGIRGTAEEIQRLQEKLDEWMEECKSLSCDREDTPDMKSYSGLLAFYQRPDSE
jgi:DNA-binding transcriptional ArsR family regulator